jgi:prepilin peptidase CpaA
MLALIVFLSCLLFAVGSGVLASISDYRGMTIPNIYSAIIVGAFVVAFGCTWIMDVDHVFQPALSHLASGAIVLVVTMALFYLKVLGGADSKLASAYALWVGLPGLVAYLFYMSLAGGILGIIALILKKWKPLKNVPEKSWIAQVQAGHSKVPYGIAIFIGVLAYFAKAGYYDLQFLAQFVQS